jgi:RNA polymerase sigma factor (sigma-70 family)
MMGAMTRDETWFERLFADTAAEITRYVLRRAGPADAEDAVGEVFLVAWRRRQDVPDSPEDLLWLYGVARRVLANARRGRRRLDRLRARIAAEPLPPAAEPEDDRIAAVRAALGRLAPDDAEVLRLSTWEELSHREIAAVLGLSENAVALRASRARKKLGEMLDRSGVQADMEAGVTRESP